MYLNNKILSKNSYVSPLPLVEMYKKKYVDRLWRIPPKRSKTETLEIVWMLWDWRDVM